MGFGLTTTARDRDNWIIAYLSGRGDGGVI